MKRSVKKGPWPAKKTASPAAGRAQRAAARLNPIEVVRQVLSDYSARGVLRGFDEVAGTGKSAFRFVWMYDQPMALIVDPARHELRFERLFSHLPARSELYANLKRFVGTLQSGELPEYRSVDPKRAKLTCTNRKNQLWLTLAVKDNQYEYAVKCFVNVVHELFLQLQQSSPEYLVEHFHVPEE